MFGAVAWSVVDKTGQQLIQFIFGIILARLLMPAEFGMIGVLMILVSLSTVLVDGGFGQAIIRKQNTSQVDYNSVFYLNLVISSFFYLVLFFSAPWIAGYFGNHDLIRVSRILFTAVLFYAVYIIQTSLLIKRLQYQSFAVINITGFLVSGAGAATAAAFGLGIWALVVQQLGYHVIRFIMLPFYVKWRPTLSFSTEFIREVWPFSFKLMQTSVLNVLFNQIYTLILVRFFTIRDVGFYYQANKLTDPINGTAMQVIHNSAFPLLSMIAPDKPRVQNVYSQLAKSISLLFFPVNAVLIVTAYPLLVTILSEKWTASVPLFQLLVTANFFTPLYFLNITLLNSQGESRRTFHIELLKKTVILISIPVLFHFGIMALLAGFLIACWVSFAYSLKQVSTILNVDLLKQLKGLFPFFLFGIVLGLLISLLNLTDTSLLVKLILQVLSAVILFITGAFTLFREHLNKILELLPYPKK